MEMVQIPYRDFNIFLLIFIRVGVVLFVLPFFNSRIIPVIAKVGLALLITMMLYPAGNIQTAPSIDNVVGMARLVLAELIIGIVLGLMIQIFFEGVKMMGQLVGFQTGFSITNIIDPQSGSQVSILANMSYLLSMVLFLMFNGHHIILNALRQSFEVIRIGVYGLDPQLLSAMMRHSGRMFLIGVKIGAPAIAALLLAKVVFGLVTKLIPQMNIMIVAFPVQIIIGLLFFGISLRVLLVFIQRYIGGLNTLLINTMEWI